MAAGGGNNSAEVVFKISARFTDCTRQIYNTQIDNATDTDAKGVVMLMRNLIEYSNNYSTQSWSL